MISQPANPVSQAESDLIWFPVRITSVLGGGAYTFQEVWITPVAIQDKVGGRYNGSFDPAYPIDGNTFSVTAEGSAVQVLARRAMGIGGVGWELKGFAASGFPRAYAGQLGVSGSLIIASGGESGWTTLGTVVLPNIGLGWFSMACSVPAWVTCATSTPWAYVIYYVEQSSDGVTWAPVSNYCLAAMASGNFGIAASNGSSGTVSFLLNRTTTSDQIRIRGNLIGTAGSSATIQEGPLPSGIVNGTYSMIAVSP